MVPQDWLDQSYDDYKARWFRTKDALWSKHGPQLQRRFLPARPLFPARHPDQHRDGRAGAARVPFDLSLFDKNEKAPDLTTEGDLGYSGLRLRTDLDDPTKKTEFCVFQGASYFRAIGIGNAYGLSARGLALKTADSRRRGVPRVHRILARGPRPRPAPHGGARADGLAVGHRRLPLHCHPGQQRR